MYDKLNNSAGKDIGISSRLKQLNGKLASLQISNENIKNLEAERHDFKIFEGIESGLFSKKDPMLQSLYDQCERPPNLQILDSYREDNQPCLKFYSYPKFFFDEWKKGMLRENEEKLKQRKLKKKQKQEMKVKEMQVKTYNENGEVVVKKIVSDNQPAVTENQPTLQTQLENLVIEEMPISPPSEEMSIIIPEAVVIPECPPMNSFAPPPPPLSPMSPVMAAPPPPPAPIEMPTSSTSHLIQNVQLKKTSFVEKGGDQRSTLLSSIRGGTKLKSVGPPAKKSQTQESNDVAAILMRRAALESSDSESDGENDSDSDWE